MKILRRLHTAYGFGVFAILFLVLFPFLLIPIIFPRQFQWIGIVNRWWAKLLFIFCFLPYRVECRTKLDPNKQYIFCPNHFSYLDIPTMGLTPVNTIFVGKSEMEKILVIVILGPTGAGYATNDKGISRIISKRDFHINTVNYITRCFTMTTIRDNLTILNMNSYIMIFIL